MANNKETDEQSKINENNQNDNSRIERHIGTGPR